MTKLQFWTCSLASLWTSSTYHHASNTRNQISYFLQHHRNHMLLSAGLPMGHSISPILFLTVSEVWGFKSQSSDCCPGRLVMHGCRPSKFRLQHAPPDLGKDLNSCFCWLGKTKTWQILLVKSQKMLLVVDQLLEKAWSRHPYNCLSTSTFFNLTPAFA